jgi:hypothetical protein
MCPVSSDQVQYIRSNTAVVLPSSLYGAGQLAVPIHCFCPSLCEGEEQSFFFSYSAMSACLASSHDNEDTPVVVVVPKTRLSWALRQRNCRFTINFMPWATRIFSRCCGSACLASRPRRSVWSMFGIRAKTGHHDYRPEK